MLNHKDKYINFHLYQQSEVQKFYLANKKYSTDEQVLVNVLLKSALVQPLDVHGVINATHSLEMLEEDSENWYFITSHLEGESIFSPSQGPLTQETTFGTEHFLQLMNTVKTYDYLTPYYQLMLLNESQFLLHQGKLVTREVFDLAFLPEILPDLNSSKAQLSSLVSQSIDLMKVNNPGTYAMVNWLPLFERASLTNTLGEAADYWSKEIQTISSRLQPEPLANLYGVKPPVEKSRAAILPGKKYDSLQPGSQSPRKNTNLAIILTCILALCLIIASFTPNIKDFVTQIASDKNQPEKDAPSTSTPKDNTSSGDSKGATGDGTGNASNTPAPESEGLIPENIAFLSGKWAYDMKQFHTGDRSLQLTLDKNNPSGTVEFSNLSIPKNAELSLWMRSDHNGSIKATFTFYKSGQLLYTYKKTLNFEAAEQWYLMNPLSDVFTENFQEANTLKIEFTGEPQILWLDDLYFESFK